MRSSLKICLNSLILTCLHDLRPDCSENNVSDLRDVTFGPRPPFAIKFVFHVTSKERLPLQLVLAACSAQPGTA